MNTSHLSALEMNLHNTRMRASRDKHGDPKLWAVWISQLEKEIVREREFLGLPSAVDVDLMTDDEFFAALDLLPVNT